MLKVLSLLVPAALLAATACSTSSANPVPSQTSTLLPQSSPTQAPVTSSPLPSTPPPTDQSPTPEPLSVVELFNDEEFFQGVHRPHAANGLIGVPELNSAGKDLVVELWVLKPESLDTAPFVEITFGAGFDNWVAVPFTLSSARYHLHRDGTLSLEPDTGPEEVVTLYAGAGPMQFRTLIDQAILGRQYAYRLNLTSGKQAPVRVRVQTEAFE